MNIELLLFNKIQELQNNILNAMINCWEHIETENKAIILKL